MTTATTLRGVAILAAVALLAGCVPYDVPDGSYMRRPYPAQSYAPPPVYTAPIYPSYAPLPPPLMEEPPDTAPAAALPPPDPLGNPPPDAPAPPPGDQATAPPSGDPVTDLLLTPLPQRDAAQGAAPGPAPAKVAPAAQTPFMGFRPMRGQTTPTP